MVMINKIFYKLKLSILLATSMVFVFGSLKVFATDIEFYQSNDILFYSPEDTVGDCIVKANNTDYSGGSILNSKQLEQLRSNAIFYQNAVAQPELAEFNIPWQVLAAIHYEETSLARGSSNADGPFQITSGGYPVKPSYTDAEFQDAADKAALFVKNKIGNLDLTKSDNIKRAFFLYNGAAGAYKTQALALGLTQNQADNGEGSPYVMNKADLKRDPGVEPTKSNNTWGQFIKNGGAVEYPADSSHYGAFIVYQSLSGLCAGGLASGGMDISQARDFMAIYRNDRNSLNYISSNHCKGFDPRSNCVGFSVYFMNKYTTIKGFKPSVTLTGNGVDITQNILLWNAGLNIVRDRTPAVYSVFSRDDHDPLDPGHTGVILGINVDKDQMIIGQASWCQPLSSFVPAIVSLKQWTKSPDYTFAHIEKYVKNI